MNAAILIAILNVLADSSGQIHRHVNTEKAILSAVNKNQPVPTPTNEASVVPQPLTNDGSSSTASSPQETSPLPSPTTELGFGIPPEATSTPKSSALSYGLGMVTYFALALL
jgi:hypothetical protein